jgi:hypothetical protein
MTFTSRELQLLSNTDVLGYIQAKNAERNVQAIAEGWQLWTLMAEAISSDFANAYELELSFARGAYSDTHKEVWGCRGYVREEHTLEQVEAELEELSEIAAEEHKAEQEWLAEQKQMERDDIMLGLVNGQCVDDVELEEWEVYEAKAEEVGH